MLIINDNHDKCDKIVGTWNMKISADENENNLDYEPPPITERMMIMVFDENSNNYDHAVFLMILLWRW